jgi:hypothetical protein
MDLAVGTDSAFGKDSNASLVGKLSNRRSDTHGVIAGTVYGNDPKKAEQGVKHRNIVVLPGFHESDQAVFAGDLKAHRIINRRVVGNEDHRATIRNSIGVDDAKSLEDRKINYAAFSEQLDRQRKTRQRTKEIGCPDRGQADDDKIHPKLAHSDSRAATLLNAITCPHPGPAGNRAVFGSFVMHKYDKTHDREHALAVKSFRE